MNRYDPHKSSIPCLYVVKRDDYLFLQTKEGYILPGQISMKLTDYVEEFPEAEVKFIVSLERLKNE